MATTHKIATDGEEWLECEVCSMKLLGKHSLRVIDDGILKKNLKVLTIVPNQNVHLRRIANGNLLNMSTVPI